jgi:putative nucleotidyltransferase with HDIG domain
VEWHPVPLVVALIVLTLLGQWLSIETSAGQLSASMVTITLAMSLLGPVPAVTCGLAAMILTSAQRRLAPPLWLNNLATFAVAPFVGGLLVRAFVGEQAHQAGQHLANSVVFGLAVLGSLIASLIVLNFVLFAVAVRIEEGRPFRRLIRELFLPLLPGQLAAGMLATILAVAYASVGLPMLFGGLAVLLILRHLTVALLRSEDRADQLEARSIQLASLQFGVLATLMNALALRDRTTARHATAVARYAKALAVEAGCDESEQEVIHTAGLLHDIGKFAFPDRILLADTPLSEADLEIVRRHPIHGADLVSRIQGYEKIAAVILAHHERVDGAGYPRRLRGDEIPALARIISVADTYDVLTARDTYRPPISSSAAIAELRNVAGSQLDGRFVELFIELLEREGIGFTHTEDADFEKELAIEERIRELAKPHVAVGGG